MRRHTATGPIAMRERYTARRDFERRTRSHICSNHFSNFISCCLCLWHASTSLLLRRQLGSRESQCLSQRRRQ